MTWDLTPGSYDHELPARLNQLRRARATKRATADQRASERALQPARERARLDTGPPDPWVNEPPDHVIQAWVEQWMSEEQDRERLEALRQAQFDDALATLLDEEHSHTNGAARPERAT